MMGLEIANAIETRKFFGVVPIGGAIIHPRWWRLQPTKGNVCASPWRAPPTKGQLRSNLVSQSLGSTPQYLGVSQVTPNQSRRHHSPKGNRCCCWWWTTCSYASKDSLPNAQFLSHRFGMVVGEGLEWKPTWGGHKLRIKWLEWMRCPRFNRTLIMHANVYDQDQGLTGRYHNTTLKHK